MVIKLTQDDIKDLKIQGFSEKEIADAVAEIEQEDLASPSSNQNYDPRSRSQTSAFATGRMDDIAKYQLELNDLLEQTEHVLKGDVVTYENGNKIWIDNPHPELNPLNKEGIRKILLELQYYINRHIILGDYDEEDIFKIMKDYGKTFANFLFMKYEEMGMDTEEKRQEYTSLVMNVVNLIYGSYSRAKDGQERRSLREMINVQQSYQNQGTISANGTQQTGQKVRGILNPMRYIQGKYV